MSETPADLSRFSAVLDYLLEHLPEAFTPNANGNAVQVSEGWPGQPENELVVLDVVEIPESNWAEIGAHHRRESVQVTIWISVGGDDLSATEARRRCDELGNQLGAWARLVQHRNLGTNVNSTTALAAWTAVEPVSFIPKFEGIGRRAVLEVRFHARQIRF